MNDYLRSFKVASYNVKETAEDEEEEEKEDVEQKPQEVGTGCFRVIHTS